MYASNRFAYSLTVICLVVSAHSNDLRYGWVPLLDQSVCRAEHVYGESAISDGMFCAGYLDEGVDTCDGDSGGPLACHHNGNNIQLFEIFKFPRFILQMSIDPEM